MEAHIITDASEPTVKGPGYIPLHGAEVGQQLIEDLKTLVKGEHGLFSIGRAWPRTSFTITVEIECFGEDKHTIKFTDTTEPPDAVRERLGLPLQSDIPHATGDEFTMTSTEMPGSKPVPIQVKRKR